MPHQAEVHRSNAKRKIVCAGRKSGKTELAIAEAVSFASQHPGSLVWWVAPSYSVSAIGFERFLKLFPPGSPQFNELIKPSKGLRMTAPMEIRFKNESLIVCHQTDNPDSLLGRDVHKVVCDEAARLKSEDWFQYIEPNLATTDGEAVFITTPTGKNWFYDLFLLGQDQSQDYYRSWQFPSTVNPRARAFVEAKRLEMGESNPLFRQEYLAEFVESASDAFRGVKDRIYPCHIRMDGSRFIAEDFREGEIYVIGVDVAKHLTYTVVSVVRYYQTESGEWRKRLVYLDRFQDFNFEIQAQKVADAWRRYGGPEVVVDATGKGDSFVEELQKVIPDYCIESFIFHTQSKQKLVQDLIADMDAGRIEYPSIEVLIGELSAFQYRMTEHGNFVYSAPRRKYDDCVYSLALAASRKEVEEVRFLDSSYRRALGF